MRKVCNHRVHVFIRFGSLQYLNVVKGAQPSTLSLECSKHDGCSTHLFALRDEVVHKVHEVIRQPYGNLLAHPTMVPNWDAIYNAHARLRSSKAHSGNPIPNSVVSTAAIE